LTCGNWKNPVYCRYNQKTGVGKGGGRGKDTGGNGHFEGSSFTVQDQHRNGKGYLITTPRSQQSSSGPVCEVTRNLCSEEKNQEGGVKERGRDQTNIQWA